MSESDIDFVKSFCDRFVPVKVELNAAKGMNTKIPLISKWPLPPFGPPRAKGNKMNQNLSPLPAHSLTPLSQNRRSADTWPTPRQFVHSLLWGLTLGLLPAVGRALPLGSRADLGRVQPNRQLKAHGGRTLIEAVDNLRTLPGLEVPLGQPGFVKATENVDCTGAVPALPQLFSIGHAYMASMSKVAGAINSGRIWRNPCGPTTAGPLDVVTRLTYTFSDPAEDVPVLDPDVRNVTGGPLPYTAYIEDGAEQRAADVRTTLATISSVINIDFVELADTQTEPAFLRIRFDPTIPATFHAIAYDGAGRPVISGFRAGSIEGINRIVFSTTPPRQQLLLALGLCPPKVDCGWARPKFPVGAFNDSTDNTLLGASSACPSVGFDPNEFLNYGPLDLAALVAAYGARSQSAPDTPTVLGPDPINIGRGGFVDTQGNNTLSTQTTGLAILSLRADGRTASRTGQALYQMTPGSRYTTGDLRSSRGGTLVGNDEDNIFYGSAYNDTVDVGGGNNRVVLGAGNDTVVLRTQTRSVEIAQFAPGSDRLALIALAPGPQVLRTHLAERSQRVQLLFAGGQLASLTCTGARPFNFTLDTTTHDPVGDLTVCGLYALNSTSGAFEGDYVPPELEPYNPVSFPVWAIPVCVAGLVGVAGTGYVLHRRYRARHPS